MIKISEDSRQIEEINIQPEQESCSCGCISHEKTDFEKENQKPINQL
ncbi:MAG: hypothetical protein ACFFG0_27595 [Candidatus Thorarchaeota archaeon]